MDTLHAQDEPSDIRAAIQRGLANRPSFAPLRWWTVVKARIARWSELDVTRKAAALSYYAAFSVVPILVIALWVGALWVDAANLRTHVLAQIGGLFGPTTSKWVDSAIAQAGEMRSGCRGGSSRSCCSSSARRRRSPSSSRASTRSSATTASWRRGWLSLVRARAYALGLILTLGFLLVLSLFANAALTSALSWGGERFGFSGRVVARSSRGLDLRQHRALFAAVYAWLPTRHIGWRAVVRATLISARCSRSGAGSWRRGSPPATRCPRSGAAPRWRSCCCGSTIRRRSSTRPRSSRPTTPCDDKAR
jgi:membrane protein